jgi:uncharacterized membrane protein YgcG
MSNKQFGILAFIAAMVIFAIAAIFIGNNTHEVQKPRPHTKVRQQIVHHLKDGRYYFQDRDGDEIYYWYFISANSGMESTLPTSLPREGQWVRSALPPEEELEEGQFEADITVNEDNGSPIAEVESQAVGDGTDTNSGASDSTAAPSDSGADSSDSGGGDSGGGDGGSD